MRTAFIGSILVIAGMALMHFSDRLVSYELWAVIPGGVMFLIGVWMIYSFRNRVISMATKSRSDGRDHRDAP